MKIQKPFCIHAVLFDFDGTLTRPHGFDWVKIKAAVGCPDNEPVLEFIENMTDAEKKRIARGQNNHGLRFHPLFDEIYRFRNFPIDYLLAGGGSFKKV